MPCDSAYSTSSVRVRLRSRMGAITSHDELDRMVDSNRNWSFPLPVHPCDIVAAPSFLASSTIFMAIRGRARAVLRG